MINIQSTLYTIPDLCKNVSLAVLYGSSGDSHVLYAGRYVYIYTHSSHYGDAGVVKAIENWYSSECYVPKRCFHVPWVRQPCITRSSFSSPG